MAGAVGVPEPQDKMMPRTCLTARAASLSSRKNGGAGRGAEEEREEEGQEEEEEEVEVLPEPGTVPENRSAAAALLSASQQTSLQRLPPTKSPQSSSDTESDFYEEIEVSCTPDCVPDNAEYHLQHGKGTRPLPASLLLSSPERAIWTRSWVGRDKTRAAVWLGPQSASKRRLAAGCSVWLR